MDKTIEQLREEIDNCDLDPDFTISLGHDWVEICKKLLEGEHNA